MQLLTQVLAMVGLGASIASLFYGIRVNIRVLGVARLKSVETLREHLVQDVDRFDRWLTHGDFKTPFTFDKRVSSEQYWYVLFGQVEPYYRRKDRGIIEHTRQAMFQIHDALTGTGFIVDNPFDGKDRQTCHREFSDLRARFISISPKSVWRLWL